MKELILYDSDNSDFISSVETVIRSKVNQWKPKELYLIRIDNWFDDKWVKFSGTIMHELSVWKSEDVTVPPFHPNRVIDCAFYCIQNGHWTKQQPEKPLHVIQAGTDNLKRKISDFSNDGLFIWYSGNSKANGKGTIMGYFVKDNDCYTFYVSLAGEKSWNVSKTTGISKKEVQEILKASTTL